MVFILKAGNQFLNFFCNEIELDIPHKSCNFSGHYSFHPKAWMDVLEFLSH